MPESNFVSCLTAFCRSGVEFILVGGLAAVLQGAPVQTYDIDIVYSRSPGNIERVLTVLSSLEAIFRISPQRRLRPTASHLQGSGHLNLLTRFGPLDLLATIGDGLAYEDLLPQSQEMLAADALPIKVLRLDLIIALKERLGGEKDLAVLPILRQTLNESKKRGS